MATAARRPEGDLRCSGEADAVAVLVPWRNTSLYGLDTDLATVNEYDN